MKTVNHHIILHFLSLEEFKIIPRFYHLKPSHLNSSLTNLLNVKFQYLFFLLIHAITLIPSFLPSSFSPAVNPRYVLRNWIAQQVITEVEKNDFRGLQKLHDILKNPFTEQKEAEELGYSSRPPSWASDLRVSCSS